MWARQVQRWSKNEFISSSRDKYSIPWKCKKDMIYFRDLTTSKKDNKINVVIMGRNTFFSLPLRNGTRELPNRLNIVISSKPELFNEDVIIFKSLSDSLTFCKKYTTKSLVWRTTS